jgi:hypothetical protein
VVLDAATPAFAAFYEAKTQWPAEAQARFKAMRLKAGP